MNRSKILLGSSDLRLSRRGLLGAAAATVMVLPRHVLGGQGHIPPSEKLNIAGVGVGGQGGWDLEQLNSQNIVALADVDWGYAAHTFDKYPRAKKYKDFRQMLDKEKAIDAVVVGTPDHNHAIVSIAAIKTGQTRLLREAAHRARFTRPARWPRPRREHKVATQMGNQGMAFEGNRLMRNGSMTARSGRFGRRTSGPTVRRTAASCRSTGPRASSGPRTNRPCRPGSTGTCGSARPRGGRTIRRMRLFAGGAGGISAPAAWAIWASTTSPRCSRRSNWARPRPSVPARPRCTRKRCPWPAASITSFPPAETVPPVKLHWYDGGLLPPRPAELEDGRELNREDGILLVGDKGKMLVEGWGGTSPRLIPEKRMQEYRPPGEDLAPIDRPSSRVDRSLQDGPATRSTFDFAGPLTEAVLLGTVCVRLGGRKLIWDSVNLQVRNVPEANNLLHYDYRKGWTL